MDAPNLAALSKRGWWPSFLAIFALPILLVFGVLAFPSLFGLTGVILAIFAITVLTIVALAGLHAQVQALRGVLVGARDDSDFSRRTLRSLAYRIEMTKWPLEAALLGSKVRVRLEDSGQELHGEVVRVVLGVHNEGLLQVELSGAATVRAASVTTLHLTGWGMNVVSELFSNQERPDHPVRVQVHGVASGQPLMDWVSRGWDSPVSHYVGLAVVRLDR